ncbi:nicotinamide riboside kinase 1 isoform X1 [Neocloeon triangulifer]|uniref:nicotinamide riboside kinase 1 isoform X1 n=1 Tax=Neocloeon triangulifer TaxID=2078957 RepID=UPI00286F7B16|nr:nicotinamide riboside kinase 1 isoform X1 [Neocloeon triangulifer]
MPTEGWLVIGVSGVTCGGKSLMARKLHSLFPGSTYLGLDRYFRDLSDPNHQKAPGLDHFNWEVPTALNFEAWRKSVQHILAGTSDDYVPCLSCPDDEKLPAKVNSFQPTLQVPQVSHKILILDGFLVFNDRWTSDLCDLKFYLTLTKEQCLERRDMRNYDPPDVPGYFEACVWPEHVNMKKQAMELNPDLVVLDGYDRQENSLDKMLQIISEFSKKQ